MKYLLLINLILNFFVTQNISTSTYPKQDIELLKLITKPIESKFLVKLGACYRDGTNVQQDYVKAFTLFQIAADRGDILAQRALGSAYRFGQGVEKNIVSAIKWYKLSAEQGDVVSQTFLGNLYRYDKTIPQNYDESFKWYQLAAEQEYKYAQFALAFMYYRGQGVSQSNDEAKKWFHKACVQGSKEGCVFYSKIISDDENLTTNPQM